MRINDSISQKCLFRLNYDVFCQKIRKIPTLEKQKIWRRSVFSRTKRFHFFKSLFFRKGKAQNMPVVAGRIVDYAFKMIRSRAVRNFWNSALPRLLPVTVGVNSRDSRLVECFEYWVPIRADEKFGPELGLHLELKYSKSLNNQKMELAHIFKTVQSYKSLSLKF